MEPKLQILARKAGFSPNIDLLLQDEATGAAAVNITFTQVDPATVATPTCTLSLTNAQILVDQLWSCGLRPTESGASAGAMGKIEDHLADMRRIVFRGKP